MTRKEQKLIAAYEEYIAALQSELNEVVPLAAAHGWKSTRYHRGVRLRAKIKRAKEALSCSEED